MNTHNYQHRIIVIAGFTVRSQYYIQAIAESQIAIEHVILYGNEQALLPGQTNKFIPNQGLENLFSADLDQDIKTTCENNSYAYTQIDVENINDGSIYQKVRSLKPDLIIFSGYGSQIVKTKLLDLKIPILHIHSGWLPDYKGSTTLYYSIIDKEKCGVTAILLSEKIDSGKIIDKKYYSIPSPGVNIDYTYDSAIRSDMLISVLKKYIESNQLEMTKQTEPGHDYYVIHPVLKHLAILKVNNKEG